MQEILKFIPWSGVAFIIASIVLVSFWLSNQDIPILGVIDHIIYHLLRYL